MRSYAEAVSLDHSAQAGGHVAAVVPNSLIQTSEERRYGRY